MNIYHSIILLFLCSVLYSQSKGGYWPFQMNGNDIAEWDNNNNEGILINNATYTSFMGINGAYLSLDMINGNDYFLIDNNPDLNFDNENIGMSVWIYPTVLNDVHYIISKGDQFIDPKTTNYALRISKTNNIEFLIRDQFNQAQKVSSSFNISLNNWQFIAVYYDLGNESVYIWNDINSGPIDSLTFNVTPIINNDPLSIGAWYKSQPTNSSVKNFEGWIDEVRISGNKDDLFSIESSLSSTTESNSIQNLQIKLYPNPVSVSKQGSSVKFNYNTEVNQKVELKIYSILGQEVYSMSFSSYHPSKYKTIPIEGLRTGVYFVSIISKNVRQSTKLIILK